MEDVKSFDAHDIYASGADVIVVGFNEVGSAYHAIQGVMKKIAEYQNDATGGVPKPTRVAAPFHSPAWRTMKMPFKRLIIDEAQLVNRRQSGLYRALKALYTDGVILVCGAWDSWHDFSAAIGFLQGHPITSDRIFIDAFSSFKETQSHDRPSAIGMKRLQNLLRGVLIKRVVPSLRTRNHIFLADPASTPESDDRLQK